MKSMSVAIWLMSALAALAAIPTLWVLTRELVRRWSTRRALRRVEEASRLVGPAEPPAAEVATLARSLAARFDPLTVERAVVALLRADAAASRAWGARLFNELGLVGPYGQRLREARKWTERTHAANILGLAAASSAVPALVSALRDRFEDEGSVKIAAANALAKLRDPTAVPLLVKELLEVDERSSRAVAEALVAFGKLAVPALLELLVARAHPTARVWAARILGRIGDVRATDDLVARLYDRDDLLRMATAEALGMLGDKRALQPLVRATLRDPAPQVRAHAAAAVARVEGENAIDVLVAALADPDYATRLRALEAFETMRVDDTSPLEAALHDPNVQVRRRAALALERVGYLERVITRLTHENAEERGRAYAALLELGRVGLLDSVASYVNHASFEVRAVAARACGELGQARVAPLLLGAVKDEEWPVRAAIAEALGRLRSEKAPAALVELLRDDEEPVREAAAEALMSYAAPDLAEHMEALAAAYEVGTVAVRTAVVVLAGRLEDARADALLVGATVDPSDGVRLRAVTSLGGRGGDKKVEPLIARLTDASLDVRMAAVAALGDAATTEAFEGLLRGLGGAPPNVRDRIADALSRGAREQLFMRLAEHEASDSLDVRIGVAWTIGKTGDPAGVPSLARFLRDANATLRASAAGALGKILSTESTQALLASAEDPDERVRAAVVNALGRLGEGEPRAVEALEKRVRDPDPFVRNRALVALARVAHADAADVVLAATDDIEPAARLVALTLVGTPDATARVLDEIAQEGVMARIVTFLSHEDASVRAAFFDALHLEDPIVTGAPVGDPAALVERYEHVLHTSLDVAARRLAIKALMRLGVGRAVEVLATTVVGDPDESVRIGAVEALQSRGQDVGARKALARAVADPSAEVAKRAVRALAGRREPEVAAALARRLGAGSPEVQGVVEGALADLHREDPMPFVDWMMGVDVPELLVPGVRVLERIANPVTFPLVRELARSRSSALRSAAVHALGVLHLPEAALAVDELMQDPSEEVRVAVVDAIQWSADVLLRTASLRRDPSVPVRVRMAMALERVPHQLVKSTLRVVETMCDDADARVRAAALATLVAIADPVGLQSFGRKWPETALDTRMELHVEPRAKEIAERVAARLTTAADPAERKHAVTALGAFGAPGFAKHVLPALRDPSHEVRIAAVQALAALDDAEVRARLTEVLTDPDSGVRDAVRRSLLRVVG